ncbi:MAG: UTRA domain-containing protein [Azospirillaceae bacterium]
MADGDAKRQVTPGSEPGESTPLYELVKRHITDGISRGTFGPGARLPSESALVRRFGASRMTINRALRELVRDGVITRRKGVGSFVSEPQHSTSLIEIRDIRETIAERGNRHSCRLIEAGRKALTAAEADLMDVPTATTAHFVRLLHCENDRPLQIESRLVRADFAPDLLSVDFERVSVYDYLQSIAPVSELEHMVEAALPDKGEAGLLDISDEHPVLRVRRRTWVGDTVVTLSSFCHPGERHRVTVRLRPSDLVARP